MDFNFPEQNWTAAGDGWRLTTPFTNIRYEPYGDDDWWIAHNNENGTGYVRGKQDGFKTEQDLRDFLYEQGCQDLRNAYERAESTIAALGEAYLPEPSLSDRAWKLTQEVEQLQVDLISDMAFRELDENTSEFTTARLVTSAFKQMDAARTLLKMLEDKGT